MHSLTFTDARKHFAETMQQVSDNAEPVRILRRDAPDVVMIDASEYDAILETLYLLRDLPPFVGIAPLGYVLCSCHIVYRNLTAFSPFGQRGAFS